MLLPSLPAVASGLIGSIVPPYPNHMSSNMGSCIPHGDEFCAYSIASLSKDDGSVVAVLAKQFINDIAGEPSWKIIDMLDAPAQNDGLIWAFEECHIDGAQDFSVVGLVSYKDMGGWLEADKTIWAVQLDVSTQKLVMPEPSRVECILP